MAAHPGGTSILLTGEEGKHAAESGMDLKAYAEMVGKKRTTLQDKMYAYEVMRSVPDVRHKDLCDNWSQLTVIHAAPSWLWYALVQQMIEDSWTVAATREKVASFYSLAWRVLSVAHMRHESPHWSAGAGGVARSSRAAREARCDEAMPGFRGFRRRVIPLRQL